MRPGDVCHGPKSYSLRLDAKSFFMSGSPPTLAADAAAIISDDPFFSEVLHRAIV